MTHERPSDDPRAWIGETLVVEIDRRLGSSHPRFPNLVYPVNYGFIPGKLAADGTEVDAYILGIERPVDQFRGTCIAIVMRTNDIEDKLVVAPSGTHFTDEQIVEALSFQERFFTSKIVRGRGVEG